MDLSYLENLEPWEWPEEAADEIAHVLEDPQAGEPERYRAAELAGSLPAMTDDVAERLLILARDTGTSDRLRAQSAIALGPVLEAMSDSEGFEDLEPPPIRRDTYVRIRRGLEEIVEATHEPALVRRRALEASVRAGADWHRRAITEAYGSQDPLWKLTAVFCMVYVPGYDAQILESLDTEDPEIHYEAVLAAGMQGVKAAWSHVHELVLSGETEKRLRIAAIEALAAIRPEAAEGALAELLTCGDTEIEDAATGALASVGALYDDGDFGDEDEGAEEDEP
jgi:hypothetical protein